MNDAMTPSLKVERDGFKKNDDLYSNSVTTPVLLSLGFTDSQIQVSRIEESQFKTRLGS